eukprot:2121685-Rhodomonas_salina.1
MLNIYARLPVAGSTVDSDSESGPGEAVPRPVSSRGSLSLTRSSLPPAGPGGLGPQEPEPEGSRGRLRLASSPSSSEPLRKELRSELPAGAASASVTVGAAACHSQYSESHFTSAHLLEAPCGVRQQQQQRARVQQQQQRARVQQQQQRARAGCFALQQRTPS